MMKFFLLTSCLLSFSASLAFAGGVSGGGGNARPNNPVSVNEVSSAIRDAHRHALFFVNFHEDLDVKDYSYWKWSEVLREKLFRGSLSFPEVILPIKIQAERNGPCFDQAGQPMDGSADASISKVCLSVPRLTEKLSVDNLRTQVVALAVHEYSHLLGSTEEEANFLQDRAIHDLAEADFYQANLDFSLAESYLGLLKEFAEKKFREPSEAQRSWRGLALESNEMAKVFSERMYYVGLGNFLHLWSKKMREFLLQTYGRLKLMKDSTCVLAKSEDWKSCQQRLNQIFRADREIDYRTYRLRLGDDPARIVEHPGVRFRRITNVESLNLELGRLQRDVAVYENYFEALN